MPEATALAGARVLVTRPRERATGLAQRVRAAGGEPLMVPAIEIAPPRDPQALERTLDQLDQFALAVFVSANAVQAACARLQARARALPRHLRVAAVGAATARALLDCGVRDALVPASRFDSETLLALPALTDVDGMRIVIFRGEGGRELLADTLQARGAQVAHAVCYRRLLPAASASLLGQHLQGGNIDIITVTSTEAAENLVKLAGNARAVLLQLPLVVASERIAAACRELGFTHPALVADNASDNAIVDAIGAWRRTRKSL